MSEIDRASAAATEHLVEVVNHGWLSVVLALGERLGLHEYLGSLRPATPETMARETGCDERYLREWLLAVCAAGLVERAETPSGTATYRMRPEYRESLTAAGGPLHWSRICVQITGLARLEDQVVEAFRTGEGLDASAWEGHLVDVLAAESAPIFAKVLLDDVVPLLGIGERLDAGSAVADLGCGTGDALCALAAAYPASDFIGLDQSADALDRARAAARAMGLTNIRFERADVEDPMDLPPLDLILAANVSHDLSDPHAFFVACHRALTEDGVLYVHELDSSDDVEENLADPHALGKLAFSLYHCVPLAQRRRGIVPGAFHGRGRYVAAMRQAGFSFVETHQVAADPVNVTIVGRR